MKIQFKQALLWLLMCLLAGCASHSVEPVDRFKNQPPVSIKPSYLKQDTTSAETDSQTDVLNLSVEPRESASTNDLTMTELDSIPWPDTSPRSTPNIADKFSDDGALVVAAERMSIRDFVHYVFGELLQVNYVLDESISAATNQLGDDGVTMSLNNPVSPRVLFELASDIMLKQNIEIVYGSDVFFINKFSQEQSNQIMVGVGRELTDVPNTMQTIMQVVPLKYGIKIGVERTLNRIVKAKITPDFTQSVLFVEGPRSSIVKALDLIDLLDTPATKSQHIGMIGLDFLTPENFATDVTVLLKNEGILASVSKTDNSNVVLVPLSQLGAVAVFATDRLFLERVRHWANIIDAPGEGSHKQYFLYYPSYARAIDIGDSVSALMGLGPTSVGAGKSSSTAANSGQNNTGNAPSVQRKQGVMTQDLKMVVDERSNTLIFYASGADYKKLFPLLKKLDVIPKQVLLDITIAEVSLQDEFKYGVEWALSRGEVNLTTDGAFGVTAIGGLGLVVSGSDGPLNANFLNSHSLVNVLSNPSQVVLDGATASFKVGSDISVVGETTQDPINGQRQTTSSEYRQTGVDVTLTPTVNAQGIVVMEVSMSISNTVPSTTGAGGNPDIFERSLSTQLVAKSGQTVMMAGLVSANTSRGGSGAPGIKNLPLIGELFKSTSDSADRTELVMMITPRVIENLDEWSDVITDFRQGMSFLKFE
jgi:general secretion pathway protein D